MPGVFKSLHHVCVVVHDLDSTLAYLESLGIAPWTPYPSASPYIELDVPDPQGSQESRVACAQLENFELQVCQPPRRPTPERRFLDEHGPGVYHLGFRVPDLDEAEGAAAALGLRTIARGRRSDGTGFCYFDTHESAGVVLEARA